MLPCESQVRLRVTYILHTHTHTQSSVNSLPSWQLGVENNVCLLAGGCSDTFRGPRGSEMKVSAPLGHLASEEKLQIQTVNKSEPEHVSEGVPCSFREEIQTGNLDVYNFYEAMVQTRECLFCSRTEETSCSHTVWS